MGTHEWEAELKLEARTAYEAMTAPAKTIAPWHQVSSAAAQMLDEGVNRLTVIDNQGQLVGIVTSADLVRAFVRSDGEIEQEIRESVLERSLLLETPGEVTVSVDKGRVTLSGDVGQRTDAEVVPALVAKGARRDRCRLLDPLAYGRRNGSAFLRSARAQLACRCRNAANRTSHAARSSRSPRPRTTLSAPA
jgi:CBS domain-containing protein